MKPKILILMFTLFITLLRILFLTRESNLNAKQYASLFITVFWRFIRMLFIAWVDVHIETHYGSSFLGELDEIARRTIMLFPFIGYAIWLWYWFFKDKPNFAEKSIANLLLRKVVPYTIGVILIIVIFRNISNRWDLNYDWISWISNILSLFIN